MLRHPPRSTLFPSTTLFRSLFLPPVRAWFSRAMGEPTPVQRAGWPVIAGGSNALLLAPTGSGKTLAAFLACLDGLWRQEDRKSTRLNSSHANISYAVFCLKK